MHRKLPGQYQTGRLPVLVKASGPVGGESNRDAAGCAGGAFVAPAQPLCWPLPELSGRPAATTEGSPSAPLCIAFGRTQTAVYLICQIPSVWLSSWADPTRAPPGNTTDLLGRAAARIAARCLIHWLAQAMRQFAQPVLPCLASKVCCRGPSAACLLEDQGYQGIRLARSSWLGSLQKSPMAGAAAAHMNMVQLFGAAPEPGCCYLLPARA